MEFGLRKIPFRQQPPFDVLYKGSKVGLFVPDLIAFDVVVVDTKVIDRITDHEVPCGSDSQFQTSQTRVGANHLMKLVFIGVYSWLYERWKESAPVHFLLLLRI